MPDAAPRLPQQLPDTQPAYAPIAPAAVVAAAAAGLFVALAVALAGFASFGGGSLLEPWLLAFPFVAVVAAFVARRQIREAEGARTGEQWANGAWYVAVAGGCLFAAYLFGVRYTVRRDAAREFTAFAQYVEKIDPDKPQDPGLIGAAFHTVTPEQRSSVRTADNLRGMEAEQKDVIQALQVSDLGRIVARNKGAAAVAVGSIYEWRAEPSKIDCVMTGTVDTPEGRRPLAVTLTAKIDPAKQRQWHVNREAGAYISRLSRPELTPYGWEVEAVSDSAAAFAKDLFNVLQRPGGSALAYDAFVRPDRTRAAALSAFERAAGTALPRAAVAGAVAGPPNGAPGAVIAPPLPPGMDADLADRVFARPDGSKPSPSDLARFRDLWSYPGRITASGGLAKGNPDTLPAFRFLPDNVEVSVPAEFILSYEGQQSPTARGYVVLRLPAADGAALAAKLSELRAAGPTDARSSDPPAGVLEARRALPWRVDRISTDLRPVAPPRRGNGPGGE